MTCAYAVTFEFAETPPMTTRGTVLGSSMPTCVARAARLAVKAHPGLRWTSLVVVLLERGLEAKSEPMAFAEQAGAEVVTTVSVRRQA